MKTIFALLCSLSCLSASENAPQWSIDKVSQGWNSPLLVQIYFHNSELQRQWAWELIGKQGLKGSEHILDFGCGEGKVSAELSRLVPHGKVTGVDISSDMLSFAHIKFPSYAYSNLEFKLSHSVDFSDIKGNNAYDVITSFCVFHQISNPVEVLKNLKNHLKPDGRLIFVVPAGKNPAFFTAANEVFTKYNLNAPWKGQTSTALTMRTVEGCKALLEEASFHPLSIEMIDTDNPFYSKEELLAWMVGNTTANWNIPISISVQFFYDLVERMCALDPEVIDQEGRVHFKLSRIHVVATAY